MAYIDTIEANGSLQSVHDTLLGSEIPGTTQTIIRNSAGQVTSIVHKVGNTIVRTDTYSRTDTTVTEVRTMVDGRSIVIETDLITKQITITEVE